MNDNDLIEGYAPDFKRAKREAAKQREEAATDADKDPDLIEFYAPDFG